MKDNRRVDIKHFVTYKGQGIREANILAWYLLYEDEEYPVDELRECGWYAQWEWRDQWQEFGEVHHGNSMVQVVAKAQKEFEEWYPFFILNRQYTPEQVAAMHNCNAETVRRILRDDNRRERIFPGAVCYGEGKRGQWFIPRADAEAFTPRKVGRPGRVTQLQTLLEKLDAVQGSEYTPEEWDAEVERYSALAEKGGKAWREIVEDYSL